jgi:hypothetical protein
MRIVRLLLLLLLATPAVAPAVWARQQASPAPKPPQSSSPQQASGQQASGPQWRRAEKTEATRGRIQFTLKGSFLKAPRNETPNRPALVVSCTPDERDASRGKFSDALLLVGSAVKIDFVEPAELTTGISYKQEVSVQFRLDNAKTREEQWAAGGDKVSAAIPKEAVKEMLRAHAVVITAKEADAAEIKMQFDMPDPAQVEKGCGLASR